MHPNKKGRLISMPAAAGFALACAVAVPASHAATVSHFDYQSAAGACQGALPAFAGTLRARPLALGNEGASPAFVTCALQSDDRPNAQARTTDVQIRVGHVGTGDPVTINCTFVHGYGAGPLATYITRTTTLSAGDDAFLEITPDELGLPHIRYAQWSCSLPPDAVVFYVTRHYDVEVGN